MAITPAVILLDAFYRRPLAGRRVLVEKIPFLLLSIVFGVVALAVGELFATPSTRCSAGTSVR